MNRTKSSIGKKAGELEDIEDKELQQLKVAIHHPNPSQQYVCIQRNELAELDENANEYLRTAGQNIKYGQTIQACFGAKKAIIIDTFICSFATQKATSLLR